MTKSELIAELADNNPHLRGADVELIVATIFDQITIALARGERVELRGFGAFTVKRRNARTGRNPRTGEAVPVDEKAVPFFKAGKELRDRVNRGRTGSQRAVIRDNPPFPSREGVRRGPRIVSTPSLRPLPQGEGENRFGGSCAC